MRKAGIDGVPKLEPLRPEDEPVAEPTTHEPVVPFAPGSSAFSTVRVPAVPSVETAPLTSDGRVDGPSFCRSVLKQIRDIERAEPGRRCVVVFDLDNTLFETRARTLAVLKAYDARHGTAWFRDLGLEDVKWNGKETCGALHLPEEVAQAVHEHWEIEFWSGEHFGEDLVIQEVFDFAWAAKQAGAEILYLTGRVEALRDPSREALAGAGLPDADDAHLFLKPDLDTSTGPFKAEQLAAWLAGGAFVGWFMTDNRKEIEAIVEHLAHHEDVPPIPSVHIEHPLQRPGRVSLDTPTFEEASLSRAITPEAARRRAKRFQPRRPAV